MECEVHILVPGLSEMDEVVEGFQIHLYEILKRLPHKKDSEK
jgi:hypothetical protein